MATLAVIQARMGSTRLPGKVLETLGGRPVLEWAIDAACRARAIDEVVVATSSSAADQAVAQLARECGVDVVTGSENDVLSRFLLALEGRRAAEVVRLTGDCPLLDAGLIDRAVHVFRSLGADYVYLGPEGGYPRGVDTEVIASRHLGAIAERSTDPDDREHVTRFVRQRPEHYKLHIEEAPGELRRPYRLCVDVPEDLSLVRSIVDDLGETARSLASVVRFLDQNPDLAAMNALVHQKKL